MEPSVYIILVNYNGFADTVECVESLQKIEYSNYQVIVVDNGSDQVPTDEQKDYLKNNCIYLESGENLGFSGGNNIGIEYAKEQNVDYVLLLNNDTTVEPDFLKKLVAAAEEKDDNGIFGCRIMHYWDREKVWFGGGTYDFEYCRASHFHEKAAGNTDAGDTTLNDTATDIVDPVEEITFQTGCLMLIPMKIIETVGLLDDSYFLYAEDTDYCCRVMKAGYHLFYRDDAVIYHKEGASAGKTSDLKQYYIVRNNMYVTKKYGTSPGKAYRKFMYETWKSVFRGRMDFKPVWCACKDFLLGETGKWAHQ